MFRTEIANCYNWNLLTSLASHYLNYDFQQQKFEISVLNKPNILVYVRYYIFVLLHSLMMTCF